MVSSHLLIFFISFFFQKKFKNAIKVSTCFDPDQAGRFIWPYLGPNCPQRLSADDTSLVVNLKKKL